MLSRNQREGAYCGRTSGACRGSRHHIRSKYGTGHPPSTSSANLEFDCRAIRRRTSDGQDALDALGVRSTAYRKPRR